MFSEHEAGHLESELLERSKECAMLRRERNEAHQKLQETPLRRGLGFRVQGFRVLGF